MSSVIKRRTTSVNPVQVEERIKQQVYEKRIRIKESFVDYDRLRKGIVIEDKFRTALILLNLHLNEEEIVYLINKYRVSNDQVNYEEFCKNINNVFESDDFLQKQIELKRQQMDQDLPAILDAFRYEIKTKRLTLKPSFQDFDTTNSSKITIDQFTRVLKKLEIVPPEPAYKKLIDFYSTNAREINYMKFCDAIDDTQEYLDMTRKDPNPRVKQTITVSSIPKQHLSIQEVEKKIQAQIVMKQIRLKEFVLDFDNLRKGTVTKDQFQRILAMATVELDSEEIETLMSKYQQANKLVNYHEFIQNMDKIFTQSDIEKNPLHQVYQIDRETTLPARRQYQSLSDQEQNELNEVIQNYRREIQNKRVLMKPHFQDFDRTKNGYISKNQFSRILYQFNLFPNNNSLDLILRKYIDNGNQDEVNYYQFCRDVDIFDEGVEIVKNHVESFKTYKPQIKPSSFILNDKPNDLKDLIAKLQNKVQEFRIRIREFLRDFDQLRSGAITQSQFRLGLNIAKIPLSDSEFDILIKEYSLGGLMMDWRKFCDTVEEVFQVKGLEKQDPQINTQEPDLKYNYGRSEITNEQINVVQKLQQRFHQFCVTTRLDIKCFFQDWDRHAHQKVTPKQFRQVLATVNFHLSNEEFDCVIQLYGNNAEKQIRYVDFIKDSFNQKPQSPQQIVKKEQRLIKDSLDKELLMQKIKKEIKIKNLRVHEYFLDFDTLRKGSCSSNKFIGVLNQMKIELSSEEYVLLQQMYQNEYDSTKVDWQRFSKDINLVFCEDELEKDPLKETQQFEIPKFLDPNTVLSNQEETKLLQLMTRLGQQVFLNRILLKPHFQDKDRAKSGKILFSRFRSILDFHKIVLTEDEFKLLSKRFSHENFEFNYLEFVEVLNKFEKN